MRQSKSKLVVRCHEAFEEFLRRAKIWFLKQLHSGEAPVTFENDEITFAVRGNQLKLRRIEAMLGDMLGKP
ncbi:hypothetical protein D3C81_2036380 [compost metagenome]